MGLRYRKSIRLFPGIRLNLGTRGFSNLSLRIKCIRLNIGRRGINGRIFIPGTGFSYHFNNRKNRKRRSR